MYCNIAPTELKAGDRIPDLSGDGPTVLSATPAEDPEHGPIVQVIFDTDPPQERSIPTEGEIYILRPE